MSKTLKQKVDHIFYKKDGTPNLRVPFKLRWSFINRLRRQNFDRAEERALLSLRRDKMSKADMKRQIKEL